MAVPDTFEDTLERAARRAYERGRMQTALMWGAVAAALTLPGFFVCNRSTLAWVCLGGFALAVTAGRFRGEAYEDGVRSGMLAGVLPCLLPAAIGALNPQVCMLMSSRGGWICGIGGVAAGFCSRPSRPGIGRAAVLGKRPADSRPLRIDRVPARRSDWLAGLLAGLIAGGGPVLAVRRAWA
jgi:hypothetical protein